MCKIQFLGANSVCLVWADQTGSIDLSLLFSIFTVVYYLYLPWHHWNLEYNIHFPDSMSTSVHHGISGKLTKIENHLIFYSICRVEVKIF